MRYRLYVCPVAATVLSIAATSITIPCSVLIHAEFYNAPLISVACTLCRCHRVDRFLLVVRIAKLDDFLLDTLRWLDVVI